ncbi:conserved hypothetical protein [Alteracholeplasma palmae J233]|uniref:Uncharacterized protein n=1 Tax=Alteracholeplasma palmae (strain ATCC 49389 / J233) TaxID=1318466 RepID=U4KKP6_ALTPJ|nr:hypothetical protein [Alteracholeplasma palmae]CCV64349.1 conserved hypothetical protein [Alteracholeplasma palmae J233]
MKKRLYIFIGALIGIILTLPIAIFKLNNDQRIIYTLFFIVATLYAFIFLFNGFPKLIVYFIYGAITTVLLYFLPDYHYAIIAIGTILFVLNPLVNIEEKLEKRVNQDFVLPLRISLRGSYWPFYNYRKEMKHYYHLPQTRKLYTKSTYLRLRQTTTLVMFFAAIYLFINELKNIAFELGNYDVQNFFMFYAVISLFIATFILYNKGFRSLLRVITILMFPPMVYAVWFTNFLVVTKIIFMLGLGFVGISALVLEIVGSLRRVAYSEYHYYDVEEQWEVFANDLFEPLVYNETFSVFGKYSFKYDLEKFKKELNSILIYANIKKFIITAYVYDGKNVIIFTEWNQKKARSAQKFVDYLEHKFNNKVTSEILYDKQKTMYEKYFFHKTEYIVARALTLSERLKELEMNNHVILSFVFSFQNPGDIESLSKKYYLTRLDELDDDEYYAVRLDAKVANNAYIIETRVRDILLDAMISQGQYVRISVYY